MKEFKDYHLYLGCEVEYQGMDSRYREFINSLSSNDDYNFIGTLLSYNLNGSIIVSHQDGDIELLLTDIKLLLRPLSDMTDAEQVEFESLTHFEKEEIECMTKSTIIQMAESSVWLLSKYFDLFGLIEAGLAIDKTTLK